MEQLVRRPSICLMLVCFLFIAKSGFAQELDAITQESRQVELASASADGAREIRVQESIELRGARINFYVHARHESSNLRLELATLAGSLELTVQGFAPMLLCGVALAGAGAKHEGATNPGILTAQEISTLDLSGCELAVFSACETSVGTRHAGQGVASLQQALHAAGVRLSLTSLWKVPDVATRQLMDAFYQRLWSDGASPQRALWKAKRTLREAKGADGKPLFTPRDWAGWVLSGVRRDKEK